jgi:PAS domain-containing protein
VDYQKVLYIVQIVGVALPIVTPVAYAVFRTIRTRVANVKKMYAAVDTLQATVNSLLKELTPNGGSSLRDAINRIETDIKQVKFLNKTHLDHAVPTAMFTSDGNGICNWVNRACCEFYDTHPGDLIGTGWENYIEQSERSYVRTEWFRAVNEERAFDMTYTVIAADNIKRKVRCRAFGSRGTGYIGYLYPDGAPDSSF